MTIIMMITEIVMIVTMMILATVMITDSKKDNKVKLYLKP